MNRELKVVNKENNKTKNRNIKGVDSNSLNNKKDFKNDKNNNNDNKNGIICN